MDLRLEVPRKLLGLLAGPGRYRVAYGGRGSAKSWSFARILLADAMGRRMRILCARELQLSIQESVHKLLCEQIQTMGLDGFFDAQKTTIKGRNGSEFIFSGIKSDPNKIKSMEGVDVCWVEEAAKVSAESWETLIPTIRKPGSEIWVTFNPESEDDPTFRRFIVNPPPDAKVLKINWEDNPWFPNELRAEKDYLYRVDPEAAAHVWGGETRRITNSQVLRGRFRIEFFEPGEDWDGPYFGSDWGFAVDPTTLVKIWAKGRSLYVEHEAYGIGVEIDQTPALFDTVPGAREHACRADSARPETISYMRRNGYPHMVAAAKGAGSVEDGVEHLRSYEEIIIHPRCTHTAQEARLWSYRTDRLSGDVLPVLLDKHNHCWDAIRYALEPISRTGGAMGYLEYIQRLNATGVQA